MCIWLYAGNSEYPALLAVNNGSENATGADNQQERLELTLENPQRPYARHPTRSDDEMVPSAWRHAVDVIQGSDVQFGRVRIRLERNSLSGNSIARTGSDPSEQSANNGEALLVCGDSRTP
jgi:hypothetical protein